MSRMTEIGRLRRTGRQFTMSSRRERGVGARRGQVRRPGGPGPRSEESTLGSRVEHALAGRAKGRTGLTREECEGLRGLQKEVGTLRTEREMLERAAALLLQGPRVRFGFIESRRPPSTCSDVSGSPGLVERVLRVAERAGLGPWATDAQLRVFDPRLPGGALGGGVAAPACLKDLRDLGEAVSRKRVVPLMQLEGVRAVPGNGSGRRR